MDWAFAFIESLGRIVEPILLLGAVGAVSVRALVGGPQRFNEKWVQNLTLVAVILLLIQFEVISRLLGYLLIALVFVFSAVT